VEASGIVGVGSGSGRFVALGPRAAFGVHESLEITRHIEGRGRCALR
jgi:hypothetical protein